MLLDRESECREVDDLLEAGRRGRGGALVISGVGGVGKTALLDYALDQSADYVSVRTAGVETETHISFSALSDLLRPLLDHIDELPVRQSGALCGALGLSAPEDSDPLTLCSSVLGLLERAAVTHPVLAVIDDAHLIDARSAETLRFVARRLKDHRIVTLFAARDGEDTRLGEGGIRRLPLEGLGPEAARELLCASVDTPSPTVVTSLIRAAGGNPLALSEYATRVSHDRLRGAEPMDAPPAPGPRITEYFSRGARRLPEDSRWALVVAAASDADEPGMALEEFEQLGIASSAFDAAEAEGLVRVDGTRLEWCHPLVAAAVYHEATSSERRAAHRTIAEARAIAEADEVRCPPKQALHLAVAGLEPDEEVAHVLERAAGDALHSGAIPAAVRLGEVAARLTPDDGNRARRLVEAAEAAALVGRRPLAERLLEDAASISDQRTRLEAARIRKSLSEELLASVTELTVQELKVARLVAQGATNREAGEALFLSARTIEFHLGHIYRKLGLRSRTELARSFASKAPEPADSPPSRRS